MNDANIFDEVGYIHDVNIKLRRELDRLRAELDRYMRRSECGRSLGDAIDNEILVKELRAENAKLKEAISGRTFYHSDEAVNEENADLRRQLATAIEERDKEREEIENLRVVSGQVHRSWWCKNCAALTQARLESNLAGVEEAKGVLIDYTSPYDVVNDAIEKIYDNLCARIEEKKHAQS